MADLNVLFASVNADSEDHATAKRWLSDVPRFATTPVTEISLVRLLLNTRVVRQALSIGQALEVLRAVKNLDHAVFLPGSTSLADSRAITRHVTGTKQVTDTHLLNLAVSADMVLTTFDARLRDGLPARFRHHVHVLS